MYRSRTDLNSRIQSKRIEQEYGIFRKNGQLMFIKKTTENYAFWVREYTTWEPETFEVFDRFLHKDKVFIDIGGWIGLTCIYASRKSKHVVVVEADPYSVRELVQNCSDNATNITVIDKAVAPTLGETVYIGKNKYDPNSRLNNSMSQVSIEHAPGSLPVLTTTVDSLLVPNVSLIKVDIEGGEEDILEDLYRIYSTLHIPVYVSFHYDWWKDKNLDRFVFLSAAQRECIRANPFESLLFAD